MEPTEVLIEIKPSIMALKAGAKTALFAFLTAILAAVTSAFNELLAYVQDGDPIDLSNTKVVAVGAVSALALGIVNALIRFAQAVQFPVIAFVANKIFGAIPTYPQKGVTQLVVDTTSVDVAQPGVPVAAIPSQTGTNEIPPLTLEVVQDTVAQYGYADVAAALATVTPSS